jgi:type I restriction-modification system DNA methylase subunit
MNSIEEYQNLVGLLQEALKFYAKKNNYVQKAGGYNELTSRIELDAGSQARFALKQAEDLTIQIQKMQEDYDKLIAASEMLQATDDMADPQELMKKFKVLGNENKNI